mgnify:CR=1 FL=1|jgi:hypothetical protein
MEICGCLNDINLKYKYICLKLVKKGKNLLNSYITGSK